jgi:hypothetical protein
MFKMPPLGAKFDNFIAHQVILNLSAPFFSLIAKP